ncbi:MAG: alpha/beta fold hydrolase [Gemmatimonadota bacterium]
MSGKAIRESMAALGVIAMTRRPTFLAFLGLILACMAPTESGHPATTDPADVDPAYPPAMIEAKFESGGYVLSGLVYVANGPGPHPTTVFLHGFPGNERNRDLAQALRRSGTNAVYFTYRGAWGNAGGFSPEHALEDAAALLATVRDSAWAARTRSDPDRVALVGHSFGGFVGALTAARDPTVLCYAHLAGANLGALRLASRADPSVREAGRASFGPDMLASGGVIEANVDTFITQIESRAEEYLTPTYAADLASRPLLVVAGTRDEATPKAVHHDPFVTALAEAGADRVTEVVYDDDHSFSAHRIELARRLVDWQAAECW